MSEPSQESRSTAGQLGRATGRVADRGLDRLLHIQRPVVLAHIRSIRKGKPDATPEELIRILERRYLATITGSGAATGAAAAIPTLGTAAGLALSSGEVVLALEASALFVQSVAEVHGVAVENPERARALVMAVILGEAGTQAVMDAVRTAQGQRSVKGARIGTMLGQNLPQPVVDLASSQLQKLLGRLAAREGASVLGRLVPFGIGAVIGGGSNFLLGRTVVVSARSAFDAAPAAFPTWLAPRTVTAEDESEPAATRRRWPRRAIRGSQSASPTDLP